VRLAVALVVASVALLAACGDEPTRVERAIDVLDDEDRFTTGEEAGEAMADVGALLQEEGTECRSADADAPRCDALLSASAAAQVTAARILTCTAPTRFEARTALADHLGALDEDPVAAGPPPAPPSC
jgi:hypothetical protein